MSGQEPLDDRDAAVLDAAMAQDGLVDEECPPESVDNAQCRWCREEFDSELGEADHICPDRRESAAWEREANIPLVKPGVHELETQLLFTENGQSPYWALVSEFDRCFAETKTDANGNTVATDDDIGAFEAAGEAWELNHDEQKVKYWEGQIAADGQEYQRYYEYNVGLVADDAVGRKRVNLQFRIAHPDMCHWRTGEPIRSLPDDLPDGVRVQTDSANVRFDDVLSVLQAFAEELTLNPEYFSREALHPWSRVTGFAQYVRIDRDVSEEKVVAPESGLLDRLADFSRVQRGRGEYQWDNVEIMGHRTHVAACEETRSQFYSESVVGTMTKSYHMQTPRGEPEAPTDHPKLEVQFSPEYSPVGAIPLSSDGVDYHDRQLPDGYDFASLRSELDEWLVNCLHWAGLPVRGDPTTYVSDAYWNVDESVRDIRVRESPLHAARDREQELAQYHVLRADATPGQRAVLQAVTDGGDGQAIESVADDVGVSERTVYRAAEQFGAILETVDGRIQAADDVVREKISELLGGLEDTMAWIEGSLDRLVDGTDRIAEDSPFAKWLRTYGVEYDDRRGHLEVHAGSYSLVEIRKLLRAGLEAARQTGPHVFDAVLDASASWREKGGDRQHAVTPFAIQGQSSIAVVGSHLLRLG